MTMKAVEKDFEAIRAEQAAFDSKLEELMVDHAGQFVVFTGGKPVAFFPTYRDAYKAGLERFGLNAVFLVSEVKKRSPEPASVSFYTGAMSVQD